MTTRLAAMLALGTVMAAAVVGVAVGGGNGGAKTSGAAVVTVTVDSDLVGERLPMKIVTPAGGGERGLLLFLHGRGQSADSFLDDAFFAALKALGDRAPIVAFPYGGDHSYWHDRDDGDWGRYVVREALPAALDRSGADGSRVAIGGISMGGFGAYDVARLNPGRFCAVGGHSPALWTEAGQTAPGAFDDAEDFERHDVIEKAARLKNLRVWLDAGRSDPFVSGDQAFDAALESANVHFWEGGHDSAYWDRHWDEYLRFYARALARC